MKGEGCTICRYKGTKLVLGWGMLVQVLLVEETWQGREQRRNISHL